MRCEACRRKREGNEPGWVRVLYTLTAGGDGDEPIVFYCPGCAKQFDQDSADVSPVDS